MKIKISLFTIIILYFLFSFVSCKKNNINLTAHENNNYNQDINKRIEAFRQQMENNLKNSAMMTLDTAIWNLEALLTNYGGYPDSASKNFLLKTGHFTLPVDINGLVSETDVQTLYQQMVDTITAQLNSIAGNVKFLKFSDVQQDSIIAGTAYISSNNGYGSGLILGLYDQFDDNWIWGTLGEEYGTSPSGNCDGTDLTSDGSDEIQYRLNHPAVATYGPCFTDIETIEMDAGDFEDENGPRLYVGNDLFYCMDINELTDNLVNADDIINTFNDIDPNTGQPMGLRPHGKSFLNVQIVDAVFVGYSYPYRHYYYVTYGIPFYCQ